MRAGGLTTTISVCSYFGIITMPASPVAPALLICTAILFYPAHTKVLPALKS